MTNVSSVGGFVTQPTAAVYAGTKFATRTIAEGMRKGNSKVSVSCVCPDVINTRLVNTINKTARKNMEAYRKSGIEPDASPHHSV